MPSASQRSLATVPQDIQYQLLNSLSDFKDLAAVVLTARPLHNAFKTHRRKVLSSVGRNFLGSLFTDALLLARCQEKRDGSDALKVKGLSSSTVRLLVNNADALAELQTIVFGLLKDENLVDINRKPTLTRFAESPPVVIPSETESLRFKFAAYRFCVYCLLQPSGRLAFLNRYPTIQILELAHFVNGLYTLIHVIRGRPPAADEQWDVAASVLSTGPHNVLQLWEMKQSKEWGFKAALKQAGACPDMEDDFMDEWCDVLDAKLAEVGDLKLAGFRNPDSKLEDSGAGVGMTDSKLEGLGISDICHRMAILDEENEKLVGALEVATAKVGLEEVERGGKARRKTRVNYSGDPFES